MTFQVAGINLDKNNAEFNYALELVEKTNRNIYLTGKAGSGKTTFLKYLRQTTNKQMVVLAPTGIAAVNAGGQTIHSFFQIAPDIYVPNDNRLRKYAEADDTDRTTVYDNFQYRKDKLNVIKSLQLLVIDEVSMVRCDILDVVDKLLRAFRKNDKAFGGVQVLLIGDVFQLAPVAGSNEWGILSKFYESSYFFSSKVIENNKPVYVELKKIYRQKDIRFIELLNKVRVKKLTDKDYEQLNSLYDPGFDVPKDKNFIILSTHNAFANDYNRTKLSGLPSKLYTFHAEITGKFSKNNYPNEEKLQLKKDAQIMFIKNDYGRIKKYYNGQIGIVEEIAQDKIIIKIKKNDNTVKIKLQKTEWENVKYTWNDRENRVDKEVLGTFTQYPVRLAWAITVHKSQGLTFENVFADLSEAFTPGQVYVALSRCTTFDGIVLKSKINKDAIKVDKNVLAFATNESSDEDIIQIIEEGEKNNLFKNFREALSQKQYEKAYNYLSKIIVVRADIDELIIKRLFKLYLSKTDNYRNILQVTNKSIVNYIRNLFNEAFYLINSRTIKCNDVENYFFQIEYNKNYLDDRNFTYKAKSIKDYERAIKLLTKITEMDPNYFYAIFFRGIAHKRLRLYKKAIADFSRSIDINSKYADSYVQRAEVLKETKEYESALDDYDRAIVIASRESEYYHERANILSIIGKDKQAINDYNTAIRLNPSNIRCYNNRGSSFETLGDISLATNDYETAIKLSNEKILDNPRDSNAFYYKAWAKNRLKKHEEVITDYSKALDIDSADEISYFYRAVAKEKLKDYKSAIADYTKAIEMNPWHKKAYFNRGIVKAQLKEYKGAIADYTKAIEMKPWRNGAYFYRGIAKAQLKDYKGAIADYTKAIEIDPWAIGAYFNRGIVKAQLKEYKGAIADYTKAIEMNHRHKKAYFNRGNAKAQLKDYNGAIADYTKFIEIDPKDVDAFYNRGNAKQQLKDYKGAIADYTKATEIDPWYVKNSICI
mgnify:CR=1 FL=1